MYFYLVLNKGMLEVKTLLKQISVQCGYYRVCVVKKSKMQSYSREYWDKDVKWVEKYVIFDRVKIQDRSVKFSISKSKALQKL